MLRPGRGPLPIRRAQPRCTAHGLQKSGQRFVGRWRRQITCRHIGGGNSFGAQRIPRCGRRCGWHRCRPVCRVHNLPRLVLELPALRSQLLGPVGELRALACQLLALGSQLLKFRADLPALRSQGARLPRKLPALRRKLLQLRCSFAGRCWRTFGQRCHHSGHHSLCICNTPPHAAAQSTQRLAPCPSIIQPPARNLVCINLDLPHQSYALSEIKNKYPKTLSVPQATETYLLN